MKKEMIFLALFVIILPFVTGEVCKDVYISNPDTKYALDITFISDFVANDALKKQAEALVEEMKITPPFDEFINGKINVRYVEVSGPKDLGCCVYSFAPFCNQASVTDLASWCSTDEVVVFTNVCGIEQPNIGPFGQHAMIVEDVNKIDPVLILHELGHSMAFLGDEYSYREEFPENYDLTKNIYDKLDFLNFPNCERHPECEEGICTCPKWKNVPGSKCIKGCGLDDWYRDSEDDLMKEGDTPGPVDSLQFRSAINRYIDYVEEPISIEINKKTTDFITGKFLEKNSEWKIGNIPTEGFKESLWTVDGGEEEFRNALTNIVASVLDIPFSGIKVFGCHDYWIESEGDPKIKVRFTDFPITYQENNQLKGSLIMDVKLEGKASINALGKINYILGPEGILKEKECKDLVEVDWKAKIPHVVFLTSLQFAKGNLGIVKVLPQVEDIDLPKKQNIQFSIDESKQKLIDLTFNGLDILDINHFSLAYDFLSNVQEDIYSFKDEINNNLDEFGLSLKVSLDMLGLEQLANMGKPHGMILDLYARELWVPAGKLTEGIEIDSSENTLRLSGPFHMNAPLIKNRAACVKDLSLNFLPIDYNSFDKNIPTDHNKFASIKLSQTFPNWFIATLWNDGFFCAKKEIPVADNPPFIPDGEFVLNKVNYGLIPLSPPYVDYTSLKDTNDDGIIDINHDLVAQGKATMELRFEYEVSDQIQKESTIIDFSYLVPFQLEESDLTLPQDLGFTTAQSFFRTDVEHTLVNIKTISCETGVICDALKLSPYKEALVQEIKENMVSHMDRALYEIELNPVRDVNLNFGDGFGSDYFTPGFNLNYGEYIAKIQTRQIDRAWAIYDFDLVPKCSAGEDCGPPGRAKITRIQEVFYKDVSCADIPHGKGAGAGCRCTKKPTEESKACIDALLSSEGKLFHYARIDYASSRDSDLVTYNFNLINWNTYASEAGKSRAIFVTESFDTYDRLFKSRNEQAGDLDSVEKDANIHKFNVEATQIVAFRAKTLKGVQQGFKDCMAAVIFDTSGDMLDYHIQGVLVKVKPRLRSDINDDYTICADDQDPEGYQTLLPHEVYSSSTLGEKK